MDNIGLFREFEMFKRARLLILTPPWNAWWKQSPILSFNISMAGASTARELGPSTSNCAASSEFGYLSPMGATKVQASLRIREVSPEPPLLAHTNSESRGTFRQKARSLAPLNGWAYAVKICHDGMLEDTNSLDAAQLTNNECFSSSLQVFFHSIWERWEFSQSNVDLLMTSFICTLICHFADLPELTTRTFIYSETKKTKYAMVNT